MITTLRLEKLFLWMTVYSIAMGYLESAVVVYLREIYYPGGFDFPMVTMTDRIAVTEILREAATVIMLLSVAWLAGDTILKRFAWFLYCFAIWDIFYYVFLKLLLSWPSSLLTWDILFLIPVVWTGPVITPVIASLTMILLAVLLLTGKIRTLFASPQWLLVLSGAFVMFLSFIWDFSSYMMRDHSLSDVFKPGISQVALKQYIPSRFNWWLFIIGELLILAGIAIACIKTKSLNHED